MKIQTPWQVLGPWIPSQTPQGLRRRYLRSALVVFIFCRGSHGRGCAHRGAGPLFHSRVCSSPKLCAAAQFAHVDSGGSGVACSLHDGSHALSLLRRWSSCRWELKIAAHIQLRLGPMRVGGWHGWLQPVADGLKLLLKEDIVPVNGGQVVHLPGPIVVLAPAYLCYAPIPFRPGACGPSTSISASFLCSASPAFPLWDFSWRVGVEQ